VLYKGSHRMSQVVQLVVLARGVELESPGVRVLVWSWSLSFQGDSNSGPYLFYLDFCVIV